ncbi:MAG: tripartite tricarboxylate transporter TctB family protein [Rubrivivax sp.]|nr:tripartite tricarboxylate transporter TctB family protein [Rubrivivax sp.]
MGPVLALLALGWLALVYTYIPGSRNEGEPGPRAFPIVLGASLLGIGILMAVSALAKGGKAAADKEKSVTRREAIVVGATFGLLMLYAFLMEKTGFLISTPIVVLLMMYGILRMRNWLFMLLMAAGITTFCWLFFVLVLGAPMPQGSWLWLL